MRECESFCSKLNKLEETEEQTEFFKSMEDMMEKSFCILRNIQSMDIACGKLGLEDEEIMSAEALHEV